MVPESPGGLTKTNQGSPPVSDSISVMGQARICIPNKFPGYDAAGQGGHTLRTTVLEGPCKSEC